MEITTKRLTIRPIQIGDEKEIHEYAGDKSLTMMYYLPNETFEETAEFVKKNAEEWKTEDQTNFEFVILLDGRIIGGCDCDLGHSDDRSYATLGWIINKNYRNRGYASEAASAILDFAFEKLKINKVYAQCDTNNPASFGVMQKIGMKCVNDKGTRTYPRTGETSGEYTCMITREEWRAACNQKRGNEMKCSSADVLKEHFEKETGINNETTVKNQYFTADKLNTRISIHSKYSTNKQGFGNWIISHYQIQEGASVLELGCGTGDMWIGKDAIISRCKHFVLSDFSEGMLNKAKETLHNQPGIEYRIIDIQDIPFSDHAFDVVIANMMLYHVSDLQKGLREVNRVLKENGTFYCATYGEHGMMDYICSLFTDHQVQNRVNDHFTLQNGEMKLKSVFSDVQSLWYEDSLEITNVDDMVDYIYSLTGMTDLQRLPRSDVKSVLVKNMRDGILYVPKEYGMFIAKKDKQIQ